MIQRHSIEHEQEQEHKQPLLSHPHQSSLRPSSSLLSRIRVVFYILILLGAWECIRFTVMRWGFMENQVANSCTVPPPHAHTLSSSSSSSSSASTLHLPSILLPAQLILHPLPTAQQQAKLFPYWIYSAQQMYYDVYSSDLSSSATSFYANCELSTADLSSLLHSDREKLRFLMFTSTPMGFNNMRQTIQTMWAMSLLSRRILIIPERYMSALDVLTIQTEQHEYKNMRRGWIRERSFNEFVVQHSLPSCNSTYLLRTESNIIYHSRADVDDLPNGAEYFRNVQSTNLLFEQHNLQPFYLQLVEQDDCSLVSIDDDGWGTMRQLYAGLRRESLESICQAGGREVRMRSEIWHVAKLILAQLPSNFLGVHWRLNDFRSRQDRMTDCNSMAHWLEFNAMLYPSKQTDAHVLFIATDEWSDDVFKCLSFIHFRFGVSIRTFHHFVHLLPATIPMQRRANDRQRDRMSESVVELKFVQAHVEQIVLAHSLHFMPTLTSSFSDYILELRLAMHHPFAMDEVRQYDADCMPMNMMSPFLSAHVKLRDYSSSPIRHSFSYSYDPTDIPTRWQEIGTLWHEEERRRKAVRAIYAETATTSSSLSSSPSSLSSLMPDLSHLEQLQNSMMPSIELPWHPLPNDTALVLQHATKFMRIHSQHVSGHIYMCYAAQHAVLHGNMTLANLAHNVYSPFLPTRYQSGAAHITHNHPRSSILPTERAVLPFQPLHLHIAVIFFIQDATELHQLTAIQLPSMQWWLFPSDQYVKVQLHFFIFTAVPVRLSTVAGLFCRRCIFNSIERFDFYSMSQAQMINTRSWPTAMHDWWTENATMAAEAFSLSHLLSAYRRIIDAQIDQLSSDYEQEMKVKIQQAQANNKTHELPENLRVLANFDLNDGDFLAEVRRVIKDKKQFQYGLDQRPAHGHTIHFFPLPSDSPLLQFHVLLSQESAWRDMDYAFIASLTVALYKPLPLTQLLRQDDSSSSASTMPFRQANATSLYWSLVQAAAHRHQRTVCSVPPPALIGVRPGVNYFTGLIGGSPLLLRPAIQWIMNTVEEDMQHGPSQQQAVKERLNMGYWNYYFQRVQAPTHVLHSVEYWRQL